MAQHRKSNKTVYAWIANGIPFYIGIGAASRQDSIKDRNRHCLFKRAKAERENCFEIRVLHKNLTWKQACELEQSYISLYGRKDNGTGILTNMTDGGEGQCNPSKQTRQKMSQWQIGKTHSQQTRRKIGEKQIGSLNHKAKSICTSFGCFGSIAEAHRHSGIPITTICKRLKSKNFTEYKYV